MTRFVRSQKFLLTVGGCAALALVLLGPGCGSTGTDRTADTGGEETGGSNGTGYRSVQPGPVAL